MLSSRKLMRPADWGRKVRSAGPERRLLLVEPDAQVASVIGLCLAWHGIGTPEMAADADEALDLLGASRQRFDLVLMAYPLPDESEIDVAAVLRNSHSPVRLVRYGGLQTEVVRRPGSFVGTAAMIDELDCAGLARGLSSILDAPVRVVDIIARRRVPETIASAWGLAIYGAAPGQSFNANRHQLAP
jgi:CheY-like chemotaxis protein